MGAAPGGKSLGLAPTGGLLAIDGLRTLGARGVLGVDVGANRGGVALLFRSLLSLRGREEGGGVEHLGPSPPRRLLEGDDDVGGIEFMSDWKHKMPNSTKLKSSNIELAMHF